MTLHFEQRVEYHYFAPDRLSEAHIRSSNGSFEWSAFIFRKNKFHAQTIAASGAGRSATVDGAMLQAETYLTEHLAAKGGRL